MRRVTNTPKRYKGLSDYAEQIEHILPEAMTSFERALPEISNRGAWALDQIKDYGSRPSKRVRGSLAAAAYDVAKGTHLSRQGLLLGAAIELIQNHLLIVDDVIDQSVSRRGEPTVHMSYKAATESDDWRANMMGVLVGLLPAYMAEYMVALIEEAPERLVAVQRLIALDVAITDIGQIDDIEQQFGNKVSREDLLRRHEQKSSYYSFVNPITCGLVLGGVDETLARRDAEHFGRPAGVAFQLRDDYLGVFGDTKQTGKPNLDDLREGKYTLMVHLAEQSATPDEIVTLESILGNPSAGEDELGQLQEIITRTGAATDAMGIAQEYGRQAIEAAKNATAWNNNFANMLGQLVTFSLERNA